MTQKGKAALFVLVSLTVILAALAGGGFYLFKQQRDKAVALEEKVKELSDKQLKTEGDLRESRRLISELQVRLQESKTQIDTLSVTLEKEKTARLEVSAKTEQLKVDLEQQKTLRLDLEKKLTQAQDDLRKTQNQLKTLDSEKKDIEEKLKQLEEKQPPEEDVELGNIVVSSEAPELTQQPETVKLPFKEPPVVSQSSLQKAKPMAPGALEGKVLVVNKEYNFAVINLGSKNGIGIGDEFSVYHNNRLLGDIKIEKIHDTMAAGGFQSADLKDKVSEGDKVVQKGK
jgi:hypothetical protein